MKITLFETEFKVISQKDSRESPAFFNIINKTPNRYEKNTM
jgi:hypothetical protein